MFVAHSFIAANIVVLGSLQYLSLETSKDLKFLFYLLRMTDGIFESVGWATNIAVLSNWFPRKGRGAIIGVWASSQNIGDIIGS